MCSCSRFKQDYIRVKRGAKFLGHFKQHGLIALAFDEWRPYFIDQELEELPVRRSPDGF
jgi:hypothetical protein